MTLDELKAKIAEVNAKKYSFGFKNISKQAMVYAYNQKEQPTPPVKLSDVDTQ